MSACPECHYYGSKVTETRRLQGGWIKRYRRCTQEECGARWSTYELPTFNVAPPDDAPPEFLLELAGRCNEF